MSYPFSRASQYAIRALVYLAHQGTGITSRQSDVAIAIDAPLPYLSKLFAVMARARFVQARRGPRGGIRLAQSAEHIQLGDVVAIIEGSPISKGCVLGNAHCNERKPCALHEKWAHIRSLILLDLERRTVAELAAHSGQREAFSGAST